MELFWKAAATVLISVILILVLGRQERDIAALITIAVCTMVGVSLMQFLEPVLDFLYTLQNTAFSDTGIFKALMKLLGISLVCEISTTICNDAGCSSLGRSLQLLGAAVILSLSLPILQSFLSLITDILGGL